METNQRRDQVVAVFLPWERMPRLQSPTGLGCTRDIAASQEAMHRPSDSDHQFSNFRSLRVPQSILRVRCRPYPEGSPRNSEIATRVASQPDSLKPISSRISVSRPTPKPPMLGSWASIYSSDQTIKVIFSRFKEKILRVSVHASRVRGTWEGSETLPCWSAVHTRAGYPTCQLLLCPGSSQWYPVRVGPHLQ